MLYQNNQTLSDPADIAECFSENFCDTPRSLHECIQPVCVTPVQYVNMIKRFFVHLYLTKPYVIRAFSKNKSKKGAIDEVLSFKLKKCVDIFSLVLNYLFNLSISSGVFPDSLKTSRVRLIFKSGEPKLRKKYRPISCFSFFCKVFEKVMQDIILKYLTIFNIILPHQKGFIKKTLSIGCHFRFFLINDTILPNQNSFL